MAVLEVDRPIADPSGDRSAGDQLHVVRGEALHVLVVGSELVVVVARQQRDPDVVPGRAELGEQLGVGLLEDVELLHPFDRGELPEPERVAVDHQLRVLVRGFQTCEEREQLIEELDLLELFVAADVEVADHVVDSIVGRRCHPGGSQRPPP